MFPVETVAQGTVARYSTNGRNKTKTAGVVVCVYTHVHVVIGSDIYRMIYIALHGQDAWPSSVYLDFEELSISLEPFSCAVTAG
jgi:hypothetical protein